MKSKPSTQLINILARKKLDFPDKKCIECGKLFKITSKATLVTKKYCSDRCTAKKYLKTCKN